MQSTILLIHATSQNIALFCCAMFAGATTYIGLVEQPTIVRAGRELTGAYILLAQPRPAIFQISFAVIGAIAGIVAGITGNAAWWFAGGVALGLTALFHQVVVMPETRRLLEIALNANDDDNIDANLLKKLSRLHAAESLAGMAALFMFIYRS